jgi:hypothetical protein
MSREELKILGTIDAQKRAKLRKKEMIRDTNFFENYTDGSCRGKETYSYTFASKEGEEVTVKGQVRFWRSGIVNSMEFEG